jgi:short-subunit dehydrogenase
MEKIALITGGSSGLGYSFAKILGKTGYSIILLARNEQKLQTKADELNKENIKTYFYTCDVSDATSLENTAKKIKDKFKKIDFLIVSAGIVSVKLLNEYPDAATLLQDIKIDLEGTILTTYYFQDFLEKGSKVLFISSGFGLMGAAGYSMYCAAKAGVINFAEAWRREVLKKGIQVYVAAPGDIDTPQYRGELEAQPQWMKKNTPRQVDSPEKVAKKILKQTKGKRKFLILPAPDVKFLNFASKILPRKWRDALLDSIFPQP